MSLCSFNIEKKNLHTFVNHRFKTRTPLVGNSSKGLVLNNTGLLSSMRLRHLYSSWGLIHFLFERLGVQNVRINKQKLNVCPISPSTLRFDFAFLPVWTMV